jgi:hypothetical protein
VGFGIYAFLRNEPNFFRFFLDFVSCWVPVSAQIFVRNRRKAGPGRPTTGIEQRGFDGDGAAHANVALGLDQVLARERAVARRIEGGRGFACLGARSGAQGGMGALGFNLVGIGHRLSHIPLVGLFISYVNPHPSPVVSQFELACYG